jgi:hypothetical protein
MVVVGKGVNVTVVGMVVVGKGVNVTVKSVGKRKRKRKQINKIQIRSFLIYD